MADSEFLLSVSGTDVADDVWNWSAVTLTDAWTQRATLTFTIRRLYDPSSYWSTGLPPESGEIFRPFRDVLFWNRLTGERLFEGFIAPAPFTKRWVDPTWQEIDVTAVAYDAALDFLVSGSAVRVNQTPEYLNRKTMYAARDRVAMVLSTALGRTNVPYRVHEPVPGSNEARTQDVDGYANADEPPFWEWGPGTNLASMIGEICANSKGAFAYGLARILKWFPGRGFIFADPTYAFRGAAPIELTDAGGYGRPAAASETYDPSSVVSGIVLNDDGYYFDGTPTAEPAVSRRLVKIAGVLYATDQDETHGWQVTRGSVTAHARDAGAASADNEPYGSYDWDSVYERAWRTSPGPNPDPFVTTLGYDVVTPLVPYDIGVGHELTFTLYPGQDEARVVQSIQTTFVDGVYDEKAADWPHYLDTAMDLDDGWDLDAAVSASKPRRMRIHTIKLEAGLSTFLGAYANRTGR